MPQKLRLAAALLGGFLLVGAVVPSVADDKCEARIHKAEDKVRRETERHGEHSQQAENARRDLEKQRARCHGDEHHDDHR